MAPRKTTRKPKIDIERVERVISFSEKYLRVPEGKDVGKPIVIRPFQRKWIEAIYGSPTRMAIISVGRKNAKTATAAVLLLAHLVGPEARPNSQLYSTARSRDQSAVVFGLAAKMVRMSPDLNGLVTVRDSAKELYCSLTGCTYKALSAEASTAHGKSPIFVVHDELGQVRGPNSELFSAIETGMGAHAAPLSIVISTQAATDADLLSTLIDDARTGADPKVKLLIHEAPKDADVDDEEAWLAANPALGDFLSIEELRSAAAKAQRMPAFEASFRNLHLNQRVAVVNAFISRDVWALNAEPADPSAFEDWPAWAGLDLSSRLDLTAMVLIAQAPDGIVHVEPHFFAPLEGIAERAERDRAPYDVWLREGLITATPGRTVDYSFVAHRIGEVMQRCRHLAAIAFDRWRIDELKRELERIDVAAPLVEHGQGFKDMSPALDKLEELALAGKLRGCGHPILTWCAANAVVTADPAGNRKLDKSKTTGRIDGLQALAMACGAMAKGAAGEQLMPPSPWENPAFEWGMI